MGFAQARPKKMAKDNNLQRTSDVVQRGRLKVPTYIYGLALRSYLGYSLRLSLFHLLPPSPTLASSLCLSGLCLPSLPHLSLAATVQLTEEEKAVLLSCRRNSVGRG